MSQGSADYQRGVRDAIEFIENAWKDADDDTRRRLYKQHGRGFGALLRRKYGLPDRLNDDKSVDTEN